MITNNEIQATKLSATKKDFYQIYNEILDTAAKLSERWDPVSTTEPDPGIVLLKVLAGIADKLNYNIDKNTLEIFMPSCAQEESMRKLTEMLGYSMKYYQSAKTTVTILYNGEDDAVIDTSSADRSIKTEITIPQFTAITNADEDVTFLTMQTVKLNGSIKSVSVDCIEGTLAECETTDSNNLIKLSAIDGYNRFFLPETQIAENGIFVTNMNGDVSYTWEKVDNLNTQLLTTKCYKFGFDSMSGYPYIQFPSSIAKLIEDGLKIKYIRTTGVNGNVSARTLSKFAEIGSIYCKADESISFEDSDFTVANTNAAKNGSNVETINQAYNSYKKTIGTFDTLVTCRDYMNKIYQMVDSLDKPLVSNIVVSDIRDDINRSVTVCGFDEYGIKYNTKSLRTDGTDKINQFDIVFYPFKTLSGSYTKDDCKNSFTYSDVNKNYIETKLAEYKTISHNIIYPDSTDIVCIKNYLKLNAFITTTYKVAQTEEAAIKQQVFNAIYKKFNLRELDFGEEIPYEDIYNCISNADERIKHVSLDEPELFTYICLRDGHEYFVKDDMDLGNSNYYNKLALRNVLANRVELFKYNKDFAASISESQYDTAATPAIKPFYPAATDTKKIVELSSENKITGSAGSGKITNYTLANNESVLFRAKNFKTTATYPAYVNYYFARDPNGTTTNIPANFISISAWIEETADRRTIANTFMNTKVSATQRGSVTISDATAYASTRATYGSLWKLNGSQYEITTAFESGITTYYYIKVNNNIFVDLHTIVTTTSYTDAEGITRKYKGIYGGTKSADNIPGYLIDAAKMKYTELSTSRGATSLVGFYVQNVNQTGSTPDGLGKTVNGSSIPANSEYQLQTDEKLYINYTPSSEDGTEQAPVNIVYSEGDIIKPNFELFNSETIQRSPTKTSGFDTALFKKFKSAETIPGMYSLGTSEQIEIRDFVEVKLTSTANIYFILTNETPDSAGNIVIPFVDNKYTLQDGEYIFYTDAYKLDCAYYGSGTEISRADSTIEIKKPAATSEITAEIILEEGISVIPWVKYVFTVSKYVSLIEYQYVTLTTGDTLVNLPTESIDNAWKSLGTGAGVEYLKAGSTTELPLSIINTTQTQWEVRSRLNFNLGPDITQTIRTVDATATSPKIENKITIKFEEGSISTASDLVAENDRPLSLKANYLCQAESDKKDVRIYNTITESYINDFKIKTFDLDETIKVTNDIEDKWTKASIAKNKEWYFNANFDISTQYALLMLYSTVANIAVQKWNGTTWADIGTSETDIKFYNGRTWEGKLMQGINVLQILTSGKYRVKNGDSELVLITGELQIVDKGTTEGINLDIIKYQKINTSTAAYDQLLSDIKAIDANWEFYYNAPVDNSVAININADNNENLMSALKWYDYNNVNNKFVISEIDLDSLSTGIKLDYSSKLNR